MLAKTGLLIVSNPTQISKVFSTINKKVKNILYVQFLSALNDPVGVFHPNVFTSWPKFTKIIYNVYSQVVNVVLFHDCSLRKLKFSTFLFQ